MPYRTPLGYPSGGGWLHVGVDAAEEEVDAEVGDYHREEGQGAVEVEAAGASVDAQRGVFACKITQSAHNQC